MKSFLRNFKPLKKDYILVIFQFILITMHFFSFLIGSSQSLLSSNIYKNNIGLFLIFLGFIGLILSFKDLSKNISPFPRPLKNGSLVTFGIYKWISHPMYYSIILISIGILFYYLSFFNFFLTTILIIIFKLKIKIEEDYLKKKYKDYQNYKKDLIL